jgi:hypothetical protein
VTIAAVQRGHPEELLTAALVLAATLAAIRGRAGWAGILLGLALATKQWALLAVLPVLLACAQGQRLRAALVAGLLAIALVAPLAAANPHRFVHNNRMAQGGWAHASRLSVWWPLGTPQRLEAAGAQSGDFTLRTLPVAKAALARPLVVAAAVALTFGFWLRRGRIMGEDTFGLLALLLLLRCLLDPTNNDYYHAPFLLSLVAWEGMRIQGVPAVGLLAALGIWATISSPWLSPESLGDQFYAVNNAFYLAWTLPLAAWLAFVLFVRGSEERAGRLAIPRLRRSPLTRPWLQPPHTPAS